MCLFLGGGFILWEIKRTLIIWSPLLSTFKGFLRVHGVLMKQWTPFNFWCWIQSKHHHIYWKCFCPFFSTAFVCEQNYGKKLKNTKSNFFFFSYLRIALEKESKQYSTFMKKISWASGLGWQKQKNIYGCPKKLQENFTAPLGHGFSLTVSDKPWPAEAKLKLLTWGKVIIGQSITY